MNNEVFENIVNNSIGNEKKCKKKFRVKEITTKISLPIILAFTVATSLTGCFFKSVPSKVDLAVSEVGKISDKYPFNLGDIRMYEKVRLYDLLDEKGVTNFSEKYAFRDYGCSAEDYRKIPELDDSYLYAMYSTSSEEDANTLAQALGYSSLDDYLIKNGFVDESGKPSIKYWRAVDAINMAEKIYSEYYEKGAVKK